MMGARAVESAACDFVGVREETVRRERLLLGDKREELGVAGYGSHGRRRSPWRRRDHGRSRWSWRDHRLLTAAARATQNCRRDAEKTGAERRERADSVHLGNADEAQMA